MERCDEQRLAQRAGHRLRHAAQARRRRGDGRDADQRGLAADDQLAIDRAITVYEDAARANPRSGEPYERIGKLIYSFYFDTCDVPDHSPLCTSAKPDPDAVNKSPLRERAEQMMAAWDEFEKRAPLDPRIDHAFLFERAILNTKMQTPEHLAAAARDYETILKRYNSDVDIDGATVGNLAETYMMLGRLDDAIEMYQRATAIGNIDAIYGLAVALDRDERTEAAEQLIVDAGQSVYKSFTDKIADYTWFFVPPQEKFYYLALAEEAFGDVDQALDDWKQFVRAGIYPDYQPRAKAHIAHLELERKLHPQIRRPQPPFDPLDE